MLYNVLSLAQGAYPTWSNLFLLRFHPKMVCWFLSLAYLCWCRLQFSSMAWSGSWKHHICHFPAVERIFDWETRKGTPELSSHLINRCVHRNWPPWSKCPLLQLNGLNLMKSSYKFWARRMWFSRTMSPARGLSHIQIKPYFSREVAMMSTRLAHDDICNAKNTGFYPVSDTAFFCIWYIVMRSSLVYLIHHIITHIRVSGPSYPDTHICIRVS